MMTAPAPAAIIVLEAGVIFVVPTAGIAIEAVLPASEIVRVEKFPVP